MLVYIIIAVILVIISLVMINAPFFQGFRKSNGRTFEFFISLISTFTGFFIALSLNSVLSDINAKKNLVKLLNVSNLAIENSEMKTKGMYLLPAKSGADLNEIISYSPLEMPKMYEDLQDNSLITDYFSSNAFQAYIWCTDNMQTFVKSANAGNLNAQKKQQLLEKYLKYLDLAKQVNTLEIQRLNGDLSSGDENTALQKLTTEISNNK